jgi:hypothetical protein
MLGRRRRRETHGRTSTVSRNSGRPTSAATQISGISSAEQRTLRLAFSRRHILEHHGGTADTKYVTETGDPAGRRERITAAFVTDAFAVAVRLADTLTLRLGRVAPEAY